MKIALTKGVYWDTESRDQTEQAREWMRENVFNKMGMSIGEPGMITPEFDAHKRPTRWILEQTNCTITVVREYIDPNGPSWAMKNDSLVITTKS